MSTTKKEQEDLLSLETRKVISMGIEAANHAAIEKAFNVGIIQT